MAVRESTEITCVDVVGQQATAKPAVLKVGSEGICEFLRPFEMV